MPSNLPFMLPYLLLAALITSAFACIGTIHSLSDVQTAVACETVNINSFTVPPGQTFTLNLVDGATVNLNGDIHFGNHSWAGPLFLVRGKGITFNGNGYTLDGGGPFHWVNGQSNIPSPMIQILMSGTFKNVNVLNSPERVYAISSNGPLVMANLVIDNSLGDLPNNKGVPAAHNTDGFDVVGEDVTIENCFVHNQDDCLAINGGSNIIFRNNTCHNGHGISIGSIKSGVTVNNVSIVDNTVTDSHQAFRIKTFSWAKGSTVSNINYSGNKATGCKRFGIIIDQSYPSTLKTPGGGVMIEGVNFMGLSTSVAVNNSAQRIAINCGSGTCAAGWDWSALIVTGGSSGNLVNAPANLVLGGYM